MSVCLITGGVDLDQQISPRPVAPWCKCFPRVTREEKIKTQNVPQATPTGPHLSLGLTSAIGCALET